MGEKYICHVYDQKMNYEGSCPLKEINEGELEANKNKLEKALEPFLIDVCYLFIEGDDWVEAIIYEKKTGYTHNIANLRGSWGNRPIEIFREKSSIVKPILTNP